ncbi:MAG: NAD-dependent deacylase [Pseudomonadota bacterium]
MTDTITTVPVAAIDSLRQASSVVVMTGAGASAESGVPTFRDAHTGLWSQYKPEALATPDAFVQDPLTAWNWYQWRRELVAATTPNAGHHALVTLAQLAPQCEVITQNVDGLHTTAGSPSVIEFHGNLFVDQCDGCGAKTRATNYEPLVAPPLCGACSHVLRPGVVLFGELIPENALRRAMTAVEQCDLFICVGTSSLVYPAAGLAQSALANGATLIEINPEETPLSGVADVVIRASAATALPALVTALQ